ncbi:MAG: hypothetical protein ABEH65_02460, partial [Halobacteriales archaeon]
MSEQYRISTIPKKWRFVCPKGHSNWFPIDGVFRCQTCAEQARLDPEIEPEFEQLKDQETGERVDREQIVLDVDH